MSPQAAAIECYEASEAFLRLLAREALNKGDEQLASDRYRAADMVHIAMFREKRGRKPDPWERSYSSADYESVA